MSTEIEGLVLMIEADGAMAVAVAEALKNVDPKLALHTFAKLDDLVAWLTKTPEPNAEPPPEGQRLVNVKLVIAAAESMRGPEDVVSWKSVVTVSGVPETVPFIVTTFDSSETAPAKWSASGIFNLMIKPFDALLLQQHLRTALKAEETSNEADVHVMKTDAIIESLKAVPMVGISEVGFLTRSERQLPLGRVTKFYSPAFGWNDLKSVYARTLTQETDETAKNGKTWRVKLTWFGVGRDQMLKVRGRFPSKEKETQVDWSSPQVLLGNLKFLILADPSLPGAELSTTLTRNFNNVEVIPSMSVPNQKATVPSPLAGIFVHRSLLDSVIADPRLKDIPRVALSERVLTDEELRGLGEKVLDVIILPTDRVTLLKKMTVFFPALSPAEERPIKSYDWSETLNVGQPVEITQMSEGGLVERYERALAPGTIRRFVLWFPSELQLPVLTARCYLTKPDPSKAGSHLNSFVFFGMSDRETKHVRIWMRDNYIKTKQKT